MFVKAHAKINLSLDVIGKRQDGYHLLKMIMQSIELSDLVKVEKNHKGINITCDKSYVPLDKKNIAYRAAELFLDYYGIEEGVDIEITKNIPIAAGLAGGSSDAAAVLKAMRDIFMPDLKNDKLVDLGLKIGADVPFCIIEGTALCEGIGEIMTSLKPFSGYILILVKPPFGVSTREVYRDLNIDMIFKHPNNESLIDYIEKGDLRSLCSNMRNVLENVTLKKHPILKKIKSEMLDLGALGSMMSGSGPTIFGFFDNIEKAQQCYDKMSAKYNEVFLTKTI